MKKDKNEKVNMAEITVSDDIVVEKDENKPPKCEVCGFSLVDSTQGKCNCGKYSW